MSHLLTTMGIGRSPLLCCCLQQTFKWIPERADRAEEVLSSGNATPTRRLSVLRIAIPLRRRPRLLQWDCGRGSASTALKDGCADLTERSDGARACRHLSQ